MADESRTVVNNINIDIDAMVPRITEEVAGRLRDRAISRLEHHVNEAVEAAVKTYIAENIVPSITAELAAHNAELRAAFVDAIRRSVLMASEKIVEHTTKKLAGYEGDKILGDIFRSIVARGY